MNKVDFKALLVSTHENICRLTAGKGEEYSSSDDQLASFKRYGVRAGLHPLKVWSVLYCKHADSIDSFVKRASKTGSMYFGTSEPIEGRIDDAILYLILLKALIKDSSVMTKGATISAAEAQKGWAGPAFIDEDEFKAPVPVVKTPPPAYYPKVEGGSSVTAKPPHHAIEIEKTPVGLRIDYSGISNPLVSNETPPVRET